MKMKNIAAVAMAGCMAASLAACGGSASSAATDASSAASTEAATSEATEATGTSANGFTVQLGSNPETLDPALNSAIDGANTLITVFERCCSSMRTTRSSPARQICPRSLRTA